MRQIATFATTLTFSLLLTATTALAQESGAGQLHATELTITKFGLGLIVAFPIFVWTMSKAQKLLDDRKDRKKAAYRRSKSSAAWRGGW